MHRALLTLLAAMIGALPMVCASGAEEKTVPQRLSIAVSGGASKGAYEAGLNWAALTLARQSATFQDPGGGQFRPIELVSVAGASAGGVNTLLSGLVWCLRPQADGGLPNRIDDNVFRDTWLRVDINALLPPRADSPIYLPDDAIFSRRDYLKSAADLRDKWRTPSFRTGCTLPMGVTVTRVEPATLQVRDIEVKNQRFYIPFELRVNEQGSIAYFFDPADYPKVSDPAMILMPRAASAPEHSISDDLIIEAATTTSAFPTAFGRRRLQYCRLQVQTGTVEPETQSAPSDTDLVCPQGYELEEAEFADGGLFDNLPIGLARTLSELHRRAVADPLPVTYLYLDPDRLRYDAPDPPDKTACASQDPPEACRIMEFSFFSESGLLRGALGTARSVELYRETTSDHWALNLSQLSYVLARILHEQYADFDCSSELPYYDGSLPCAAAVSRGGRLLEIVYDRVSPAITPPYSVERLTDAGIAESCTRTRQRPGSEPVFTCRMNITRLRGQFAEALLGIMERANVGDQRLYVSISRSRQSIHHDRALQVTSRGAPITGTLLADFGSFLDYKFRVYDYYVGVYDAIVRITRQLCSLQFSRERQAEEFAECLDGLGKKLYGAVGIEESESGRYVFARLAEREFADSGSFEFSYSPLPPADRDMQIIHDGLAKALQAGEARTSEETNFFVTEDTFFAYLKAEKFVPTPTTDGAEPLLAEIIEDPETWSTELTRRFTARLVLLERQAAKIYAAREPDPDLREDSHTTLMGGIAHTLQSMTYTYPALSFSPSTAPVDWLWRYVVPYELSGDLVEGDIIVLWQPTIALSKNNLLHVRAGLGFAGGLFRSSSSQTRENYLAIGLGYSRRTGSSILSSFGLTPTWYRTWKEPVVGDQSTLGGDVHVTFLSERLRVGVGARDFDRFADSWFLSVGLTDVPGVTYWLTR